MSRAASLLLVIMTVGSAFAQQSVAEAAAQSRAAAEAKKAAAAPPTREEVLKLFDLLQITKTMDAVVNATKQQSMEIAEQMIHEKMPEATAGCARRARRLRLPPPADAPPRRPGAGAAGRVASQSPVVRGRVDGRRRAACCRHPRPRFH